MKRDLQPLETGVHRPREQRAQRRLKAPCDVATMRYIARDGPVTARDVAARFGLTLSGALTRLKRVSPWTEKKRIADCDPLYLATDDGRAALREVSP